MQRFNVPKDRNGLLKLLKQINEDKGPSLIASGSKRMSLMKLLILLQDERFLGEYGLPHDEEIKLDQAKENIAAFISEHIDKTPHTFADIINILQDDQLKHTLPESRQSVGIIVDAIDTIQEYMIARHEFLDSEIKRLQALPPNSAAYAEQERRIMSHDLEMLEGYLKTAQELPLKELPEKDPAEITKDTAINAFKSVSNIPDTILQYQAASKKYKEYEELATNAKSLLNAIKHRFPEIISPDSSKRKKQ